MRAIASLLVTIAFLGCNAVLPLEFEGESFDLMLGRAAHPRDFTEGYANVKALMADVSKLAPALANVLRNPARTPIEREVAAYVLERKKVRAKAEDDALASYFVSRLKDPDYHRHDLLAPFSAHRHGGGVVVVGKDGKRIYAQYRCGGDEIEGLGEPALKYLIPLLNEKDIKLRLLAHELVEMITNLDLPYDVFAADNSELVKVLKEKGWLKK